MVQGPGFAGACAVRPCWGFGRSKVFNTVGAWRGGETVKLTVDNLPPHTHPQNVSVDFGRSGEAP